MAGRTDLDGALLEIASPILPRGGVSSRFPAQSSPLQPATCFDFLNCLPYTSHGREFPRRLTEGNFMVTGLQTGPAVAHRPGGWDKSGKLFCPIIRRAKPYSGLVRLFCWGNESVQTLLIRQDRIKTVRANQDSQASGLVRLERSQTPGAPCTRGSVGF